MISNCLIQAAAAWWVLGGRLRAKRGWCGIPHFWLKTQWGEVDFTPWINRRDPNEVAPKLDLPLLFDGKWRVRPRRA